jgi:hypothetical protein
MTGFLLQKGEQIRQAGKAFALPGVWTFEGCLPDPFTPALCLPQTQQVRYITLFPAHNDFPSNGQDQPQRHRKFQELPKFQRFQKLGAGNLGNRSAQRSQRSL